MTPEIRKKLGRQRFNVSHLIVREIRLLGHTGSSLSRSLGVSHTIVNDTIRGDKHSPIVLDALRSLGISEKLLFDPKKMEVA